MHAVNPSSIQSPSLHSPPINSDIELDVPSTIDPGSPADQTSSLTVPQLSAQAPTFVPPTRHSWQRKTLNVLPSVLVTFVESIANHLQGNSAVIGSKASADGTPLFTNFAANAFIVNGVKGNVKSVASYKEQALVLLAIIAGTAAIDALVGTFIPGVGVITETTAIAITIAAQHLVKNATCAIAGTVSYGEYTEEDIKKAINPETLQRRRIALALFPALVNLPIAACAHLFDTASSITMIMYRLLSMTIRKSGKTSFHIIEKSSHRRLFLLAQMVGVIATSALMGACFKQQDDQATGFDVVWKTAAHYLGGSSAIATLNLLLLLGKAGTKKARVLMGDLVQQARRVEKTISTKKRWARTALYTAVTAGAAGAHCAISYLSETYQKPFSLAVKLCHEGFAFDNLREMLKGVHGGKKAGILGAAALLPAAAQVVSNAATGSWSSLSTLAVGVAQPIAFAAKWLRNTILPKD